MNLQRRLVSTVTLVTVVTLGVAFSLVGRAIDRSQERQLDEALLGEAHEEASEAASVGGKQLAISARPGPAADDIGHLTKYAAIYSARGELVASTETFHGMPPDYSTVRHAPGECFDLELQPEHEHLRCVIVPVPGSDSLLFLGAPRFDLDRDSAFMRRVMLLALLAAAIWAAVIGAWVVRRMTRGHETIAAVARQVAAGDLSARIGSHVADHEMAQLGADLNHMIERLATLLGSQQEFIAHAAHELRSPLTLLYGELSHALRRSRDEETYRKAIEDALGSTRRLKTLAEDLLALARIGASEQPTEQARPLELVREVVQALGGEAAEHEVTLRVAGDCAAVRGRPLDIERLFRNLVENAIRHSPRGGVVEVILADSPAAAPAVTIAVVDEGPGVPVADRGLIFEPFYRGARERGAEMPGVGLGLAIARKIARAHGGDVVLGGQRPRGAEFVVRLPVA